MMPIDRKPTAFRGPALLLTLTLAGGLALSGCSDDSALNTPAPAPTPAPRPPAPTLAAPAGLMVADTGANFIEFRWQPVEGASGYEIHLSFTAGDFSTVSAANVTGTMHRFPVEPETTAYARVRATATGVTSDWSDAVSGTSSAAPIVLGVPMPRVSSTGPDHIEWAWAAVPDAQGYQVQVADSEDGLAEAPMVPTPNTTHRVTADPETTMYIRVRAAILTPSVAAGAWSDAVEGMSAAAPTFLTVSMTPPEAGADSACRGQAFCPDEGTDAATAMASVNPGMMVTSSHPAEVSATFVRNASWFGRLAEGENTPFSNVILAALQQTIAGDGVIFEFRRLSTGAGQEPASGAEVRYITCGPFRCSESSDERPPAPDITIEDSAACTDFVAEFTLTAGAMRNGTPNQPNGLDLGWTYTSTGPATVTHVLPSAGGLRVAAPAIDRTSFGKPLGATRDDARKINVFGGVLDTDVDSFKAFGVHDLEMTTDGPIRNGTADCFFESDSAVGDRRWTGTSPGPPAFRPDAWKVDWGTYSLFGTVGAATTVRRPEECFRIIVDDTSGCTTGHGGNCQGVTRADYLEGYSLEVQPQASVTWFGSRVKWPRGSDPFEGLDCPARTVTTDHVEVCELFAEEVDLYWGRGRVAIVGDRDAFGDGPEEWRLRPVIADNTYGTTRTLLALQVARNFPAPPGLRGVDDQTHDPRYIARPSGSRFSSLWLSDTTEIPFDHDDLDRLGVLGIDRTRNDRNLYYPSPRHAFQVWLPLKQFGIGIGSTNVGYRIGDEGGPVNRPVQRGIITFPMLDGDHRQRHGDFGKLDFDDNGQADNFTSAFWADDRECDTTDGGEKKCDVDGVEFTGEVTFVMSRDSLQCAQTRDISLTCDWDADGDDGKNRVFDAANADKFIACRPN